MSEEEVKKSLECPRCPVFHDPTCGQSYRRPAIPVHRVIRSIKNSGNRSDAVATRRRTCSMRREPIYSRPLLPRVALLVFLGAVGRSGDLVLGNEDPPGWTLRQLLVLLSPCVTRGFMKLLLDECCEIRRSELQEGALPNAALTQRSRAWGRCIQ